MAHVWGHRGSSAGSVAPCTRVDTVHRGGFAPSRAPWITMIACLEARAPLQLGEQTSMHRG
jgi:hypothetical protein